MRMTLTLIDDGELEPDSIIFRRAKFFLRGGLSGVRDITAGARGARNGGAPA